MTESSPVAATGPDARTDAQLAGMRVLYVIDNLSMGGTQSLLRKTLTGLGGRGVDARLCVLGGSERTAGEWPADLDPCYLNARDDYRNPVAFRRDVQRLRQVIDQAAPDVVHSFLWRSDVIAARACGGRRCRHLSHVVDRRLWQQSPHVKHRLRRAFTRYAFARSGTRFLAVSSAARRYAIETLRLAPQHVRVVYNSVDPVEFADLPVAAGGNRGLVLGMASRLEAEKGHVYLFQAMRELQDRGLPVTLRVTGEGPAKSALQRCAADLGIASRVEFVGWVASVPSFLSEIDVFVVPSIHSEGLPTTILEAMAAGRTVVATDVGGAVEALRDQVEGLIVPARDASALAVAVAGLAQAPERLDEFACAARQRVARRFSVAGMIDEIAGAYTDTDWWKRGHGSNRRWLPSAMPATPGEQGEDEQRWTSGGLADSAAGQASRASARRDDRPMALDDRPERVR